MVKVWNQEVTSIGYGLASLTVGANTPSEEQAFDCLRTAAELGCLVWNAGEFYGPPTHNSLTLLNRFYAKYPEYAEQVILNVKGAARPDFTVNGDPEFVKKTVENCLSLLGGKGKVSMYETARIDVNIPQGDYRHLFPRYQPDTLAQNGKLVQEVKKLAQKKGCTTAQVSLGWLLGLSNQKDMPVILPIPGSGAY